MISVLCAASPFPDTGRLAGDLALLELARRNGLEDRMRFYRLFDPVELSEARCTEPPPHESLPLRHRSLRGRLDEVEASEAILVWGDGLPDPGGFEGAASALVELGTSPDSGAGRRRALRQLLLAGLPDEALRRVTLFGISLEPDAPGAASDFARARARLLRLAPSVWAREPGSAFRASVLRGEVGRCRVGGDPLLLLRGEMLAELPRTRCSTKEKRGAVGVFFGRTRGSLRGVGRFTRAVARRFETKAEWIPWGEPPAYRAVLDTLREEAAKLRPRKLSGTPTIGDRLAMVADFELVITDEERLAVCAWKEGVPAVLVREIGGAEEEVREAHAFGAMYDTSPFFVPLETLADGRSRRQAAARLAGAARDRRRVEAITARVRLHRDRMEEELVGILKRAGEAGGTPASQPAHSPAPGITPSGSPS